MAPRTKKQASTKQVTRYTHDEVMEPGSPETGHTELLPDDEETVTVLLDNGWSKALDVGRLENGDDKPVVVDLDPAADPVLFWAGKRSRREVALLPLQRNEIVTESRIKQIIERAMAASAAPEGAQTSLFANLERSLRESDRKKRVEFYKHEEGWKNKLICGDSLEVMESLIKYENLRGKVQMIYVDPPYGIKYNSNFQQRVNDTQNDERDQADDVLTIKAFRDTWALGIHSYLGYLAERLYLCRELLSNSGSIFVQISDENVHRVRLVLDEVFGADNFCALIPFRKKTMPLGGKIIEQMHDFLVWYAREKYDLSGNLKVHFTQLYQTQDVQGDFHWNWYALADGTTHHMTPEQNANHRLLPRGARAYRLVSMYPPTFSENSVFKYQFNGQEFDPGEFGQCWVVGESEKLDRLRDAGRLQVEGKHLRYRLFLDDGDVVKLTACWNDTIGARDKSYVVQTSEEVVRRCVYMTTSPGDLVLDPTCGGGTTAVVAEESGRRWVTCDTSRVAVNVARGRLLRTTFKHYRLRQAGRLSAGIEHETLKVTSLKTIANAEEPKLIALVDRMAEDPGAVRVCGPFEVMSLGRYSVEDWKGHVRTKPDGDEAAESRLENYISVICRLYRKHAAIQGSAGLVHAVCEEGDERIALSVGPLTGRVTAKQVVDATQDAQALGLLEVHILGWAFEANVGEVKSRLEKRGHLKVQLIMIRPDTLAQGLKVTDREGLFSPLSLPVVEVQKQQGKSGTEYVVELKSVVVYDRQTRQTKNFAADSKYVAAWYLDEDYDGDCFVDCQMFFDFKKAPTLRGIVSGEVPAAEFKLQPRSLPFPVRAHKRIAIKVVDVFGNESTVVRDLG